MAKAIVVMGVSGCGKTSVGNALSEALGWPFYDGDDFHPQANIAKMAKGIPLNDTDRQPWLERLHQLILENIEAGRSVIVACSALKAKYRTTLKGGHKDIYFVHLVGSFELIFERMQRRADHYMKAEMLRSQFQTLEAPSDALAVPIDQPVEDVVQSIIAGLSLN